MHGMMEATRRKVKVNADEFRNAMAELDITDPDEMAVKLGCHRSTVSRLLGGEYPISVNMIAQFTELWGVQRMHKICDEFGKKAAA